MILIFDGETSSKSMLLLMRRHWFLGLFFFYDKKGECSLRGCILIKITHVGGTLMILIFDGETLSKSMLLLMRRHLVFRFFFLLVLPMWLYSYKDYSCRGNLDGSHF